MKPFAFRESKSGITILTINEVLKQKMFEFTKYEGKNLNLQLSCMTNKQNVHYIRTMFEICSRKTGIFLKYWGRYLSFVMRVYFLNMPTSYTPFDSKTNIEGSKQNIDKNILDKDPHHRV